jgi:hypothetical protein
MNFCQFEFFYLFIYGEYCIGHKPQEINYMKWNFYSLCCHFQVTFDYSDVPLYFIGLIDFYILVCNMK